MDSFADASRPPPGRQPWRGVSLGGWLLLEPGPSGALFEEGRRLLQGSGDAPQFTCEWELMEVLRREGALSALEKHRETYIGRRDFERIREMGLNAVRVPFGYWVAVGSTAGDPYEGPALEFLDRAVDWAEEFGLQVLLDLHGCPGGESCEAPCGRRQRPHDRWSWEHWRLDESLRALGVVVRRYRGRSVVTGIAVCNEPSPKVPLDVLCRYYMRAAQAVRKAGMCSDQVTVVLPVFQRSVPEFASAWSKCAGRKFENVCFEVHWYHCFENEWHGMTFAQHLRAVQDHAHELNKYPMMVGEWSLALGRGAQPGKLSREELRVGFARAQLAAYRQASHGWFFWNWKDGHSAEWDCQRSYEEGCLPLGELREGVQPALPELPPCCEDSFRDPLEKVFDTPPSEPRIRMGDTVYLRAFNGRYIDVEGTQVRARYDDRGRWQQFVVCPYGNSESCTLLNGDIVCLMAHTGRFLGVTGRRVTARWAVAEKPCAIVVRIQGASELRHRSTVFLQSKATSKMLAPNEGGEVVKAAKNEMVARWKDFGLWQRFVVEKPLSTAVTPRRPRRRSSLPGTASSAALSVPRRVSDGGSESQVATPSLRRRMNDDTDVRTTPRLRRRVSDSSDVQSTPSLRRRSSDCCDKPVQTPSRRPRGIVDQASPQRRCRLKADLDQLFAVATPVRVPCSADLDGESRPAADIATSGMAAAGGS